MSLPQQARQENKVVTLENLANQANEHYEESLAKADKAKGAVNEAIAEALLCGKALNDAKEQIPHGKWLQWLKDWCPKISQPTAWKYMKLANYNHGYNLESASGLRKAYQLAGLIPDDEKKPQNITADSAETTVFNLTSISKGVLTLVKASEHPEAVTNLGDDEKDALRIDLERAAHAIAVTLAFLNGEPVEKFVQL